MIRIAIYDLQSGDILRTVECPTESADAQCGETEGYIRVTERIHDSTHRVDIARQRAVKKRSNLVFEYEGQPYSFLDVADAQNHFINQVDRISEAARFVSPAQESVYQLKLTEARAGGGPMIEAEAEAIGKDIDEVCRNVLSARGKWEQHASMVESERMKTKASIRSLRKPSDMHLVLQSFRESIQ